MIRKLISMLLCAFALLLLMGAGTAPQQPVTVLAEEESAGDGEDTAASGQEPEEGDSGSES